MRHVGLLHGELMPVEVHPERQTNLCAIADPPVRNDRGNHRDY
jgi:hypothetical protein